MPLLQKRLGALVRFAPRLFKKLISGSANVLEFWYRALRADFGIVVDVDDFNLARAKLYKARKDSGDKDLDSLSISQSPTSQNQLWIVKNEPSK